jgi:NAD(P)-dependent dehydrogenase (short-subunit alcohol dehydrogenase family)
MSADPGKVWLVTGASRGFGRAFVNAALSRGDQVAATARDVTKLNDLVAAHGDAILPIELDVTHEQAVHDAVGAAAEHFGRLDIVVNNAGYGLFGAFEELTSQQLRDQVETNLFGPFYVVQAALPILRQQGKGHIVQISTIGGIAAFPNLSGYHASKWALEGMTEAMAQEVAGFGITVTLVEPGPFGTDWSGSSAVHAEPLPAYQPLRDAMRARAGGAAAGDPTAAAQAILAIVDAEEPPLRVLFGTLPTQIVKQVYAQRLEVWADYEDIALQAQGAASEAET